MDELDNMELIYSLVGFPDETEWLEFKDSQGDPERIGRDISALANSAALHRRSRAYKIWGVEDGSHRLVGTRFNPYRTKARGNQDLLIWLRSMLSKNASYEFGSVEHDGMEFVVLQIAAASNQPVCFDNVAYIRSGSSTTTLLPGSATEVKLWRRLQSRDYELQPSLTGLDATHALELLDVDAYYRLMGMRKPGKVEAILLDMCEQGLLQERDDRSYAVTNLGALLVAKSFGPFHNLKKRPLRFLRFVGTGNTDIADDVIFDKGYALAIGEAERYIMAATASSEHDEGAFRKVDELYPKRAVRELLANAVIHQDLSDGTSGPLVSLYANRIQFSNPGASLIPLERILNAVPKTRNPRLVDLLRQMDLCEEGGTGWDRAVEALEAAHMAAPKMRSSEELGTQVTLFAGSAYGRMTRQERKDAVYWHACLQFARDSSMSNQSLRERFGLDKNMVAMSRLIRECLQDGLIKEEDAEASDRYRRYIPAWA